MDRGAIMVVEDDDDNAELTLYALREGGVANDVIRARDGLEALEILLAPIAAPRPTLILLDLKMPRMDGLETLRRLRSDVRTRATPVLVVSTSESVEDISRSYAAGANGYIFKLLSFGDFSNAVRAAANFWLNGSLATAKSPRLRA